MTLSDLRDRVDDLRWSVDSEPSPELNSYCGGYLAACKLILVIIDQVLEVEE